MATTTAAVRIDERTERYRAAERALWSHYRLDVRVVDGAGRVPWLDDRPGVGGAVGRFPGSDKENTGGMER